jgi:hypothetical protein
MSSTQVLLGGAAFVVIFDAIASLISRAAEISYVRFSVGSWIIYALAGYLAARFAHDKAVQTAILGGVLLGATDSTLGWAISWLIGPGRMNGLTPGRWLGIAVFVTLTASVVAGLAGLFARIMSTASQA